MENKLLLMLGLAMKAGRIRHGAEMTDTAVRSGKAKVVVAAADRSDRVGIALAQWQRERPKLAVIHMSASMLELGAAIGKKPVAVLAVTDSNMAKKLIQINQLLNSSCNGTTE